MMNLLGVGNASLIGFRSGEEEVKLEGGGGVRDEEEEVGKEGERGEKVESFLVVTAEVVRVEATGSQLQLFSSEVGNGGAHFGEAEKKNDDEEKERERKRKEGSTSGSVTNPPLLTASVGGDDLFPVAELEFGQGGGWEEEGGEDEEDGGEEGGGGGWEEVGGGGWEEGGGGGAGEAEGLGFNLVVHDPENIPVFVFPAVAQGINPRAIYDLPRVSMTSKSDFFMRLHQIYVDDGNSNVGSMAEFQYHI